MTTWQVDELSGRGLRQMTATFGLGLHVLQALDPTGIDELVPLLDGSAAPRRGRVLLDGRSPYRCPELRRHIGSLWSVESLPDATTVESSLRKLELDSVVLDRGAALLERFGQADLLTRPTKCLSQNQTRMVALAVALSKPDPVSFLLTEPLVGASEQASSVITQLLLERALHIPILVVTSSRTTALRFGGPCAELGGGFWRRVLQGRSQHFTLRVAGASLRPLAAEIVRRPLVRALRLTTQSEGHDEIWLETVDPNRVALDLVRLTQQLGLRLWSLSTLVGSE
jgi:ABC-type transport system involved in cytochrome c biogenesis ATPase subunit